VGKDGLEIIFKIRTKNEEIAADSSNGVTNTNAVDTVVCAPDDG
jgi:hypothetical protein